MRFISVQESGAAGGHHATPRPPSTHGGTWEGNCQSNCELGLAVRHADRPVLHTTTYWTTGWLTDPTKHDR